MLNVATMDPNGLIVFVHELLYHQTPMTRRREEKEAGNVVGNTFGLEPTVEIASALGLKASGITPARLQRRFSGLDQGYWSGRDTGASKRRSFVRFWIMVEPTAWFA